MTLTSTTFSQKKLVDTLVILGHKYTFERTKLYHVGTEELPLSVIKCRHKGIDKDVEIRVFSRYKSISGSFDASGEESIEEQYNGTETKVRSLRNFLDTLRIDKESSKGKFIIKIQGVANQVDQIQFVVSNDTCTKLISTTTGMASNPLERIFWYIDDIKPKYALLTSMFYSDKSGNVYYIPAQFCLKIE